MGDVKLMLVYCWASVVDGALTIPHLQCVSNDRAMPHSMGNKYVISEDQCFTWWNPANMTQVVHQIE